VANGVDLSKILVGNQNNQNVGLGQKMSKPDEIIGVSQLLGHVPGLPPKSTPLAVALTKEELK